MKFFAIILGALGLVQGFNNVNVDNACSIGSDCIKCLSRTSPDLERCQQLYFYVTYTNTGNQREIDRYCTGDCPIVLATANSFCSSTGQNTNELLRLCPSYSYVPTGSFNVNYNETCAYSSSTGRCGHCLGNDNRGTVRCLQLYLLATAANFTSVYSSMFCKNDCPALLSNYQWYCDNSSPATLGYSYCQSNGNRNCGDLEFSYNSGLGTGAASCRSNCSSSSCALAISEYGCCLRSMIGNTCSNIPTCSLPVDVPIRNLNIDERCPVAGCSQCLARGSSRLEQCQQRNNYLSFVDTNMRSSVLSDAASQASTMNNYCSGECPALLSTSSFYCSGIESSAVSDTLCPSYNFVPSSSVDVRATYGSGRTCSVREDCAECIARRSPEATRCQQLYSLTFHPNQSSYYLNLYCSSNCPLTLGTAGWYCNSITTQSLFDRCMQRNTGGASNFCASLILQDSSEFVTATSSCILNCTSATCELAKNRYGCCLNMNPTVAANCNIRACDIMTAGSPPVTIASLTAAVLSVLTFFLLN